MIRSTLLFALLLTFMAGETTIAAQTVHVAGATGSSQFLQAALGADKLALKEIADKVANGTWTAGQKTTFHWTAKNSANIIDNRDTLGRIQPEVGNIFVVWIADASDGTGNTNVTDIWTAGQVDATVAVRAFSAQETTGSGALLVVIPAAQGNLVSPSSLWPDGQPDVTLIGVTNVSNAIGTNSSSAVHINAALTDLRPEDALYATTRAIAKLNTTNWSGLGYVGPSPNIGAPIYSAQSGSTLSSTPVKFALSGGVDPITHITVPAYTTIPIGASPFIFVLNNGGTFSSSTANFISGVGTHVFPLAHLFDGTTAADTHNAAFGGSGDGAGTPLTLILREPLSAAANVVEFGAFRTTGNTLDSQEVGVINPTRSPYNPLNLSTPVHGVRQRANSTSEVVAALQKTADSVGYFAFGFANASKLSGASWNYLTVDGVDPLGIPGTVNQELPNGTVTSATSVWPTSASYPNIRNGSYKLWAVERYLVANSNIGTDPYGPDVLAQSEQDNIDSTVADFVPFHTSDGSDGLEVYRSHFTQSGVTGDNGTATAANLLDGGNTLGGGTEKGGDVGGAVQGPFGITVPETTGNVTTVSALTKGKGYRVTWKSGLQFVAGTAWEGGTITINGTNFTIASVPLTATVLYVTASPGANTVAVPYAAAFPHTYAAAVAPGVLNKKQ
jgi:hypothetical protein